LKREGGREVKGEREGPYSDEPKGWGAGKKERTVSSWKIETWKEKASNHDRKREIAELKSGGEVGGPEQWPK